MASSLVLSAQAPTAFQEATRSLSPALDANGKGRRHSAFSRGHHVHVVSNHNQKRVSPCLFDADASSLLNWRGLERSASFSRLHSHRQGASLPLCRLVARGAFASDPAITNSANLAGANRLCVRNTLPNQHVSQAVADRLHHQTFLFRSCTVREVSCATKGLGNARKAFGEIRNV